MTDTQDLTVTTGGPATVTDGDTDVEDLSLEGLDELDGVIDDDVLPGDDPGFELSSEVDPGGTPDEPLVPTQGTRS